MTTTGLTGEHSPGRQKRQSRQEQLGPPGHPGRGSFIVTMLALLFCLYLASPALTSEHVEGFSAQIQSLALMLDGPGISQHDLTLPRISQFLFFSRSGVVDLLAGLDLLRGSDDWNFRLLTLSSLVGLVGSSMYIAHAWGAVRPLHALVVLALMPGVFALGFYFNDNVVSAALAALAAAVVIPGGRVWRFAAAGAFMAAAILSRVDAVLALPLVGGLALLQRPEAPVSLQRIAASAALFLLGMLPVLLAAMLLNGFSLLDAYSILHSFQPLPPGRLVILKKGIYFFGLLAPPLVLAGVLAEVMPAGAAPGLRAALTDRARVWRLLVFVVYPALLICYALVAATESRYFYPLLTPMIALHGGRGLARLLQGLRAAYRSVRIACLVCVVIGALGIVGPPLFLELGDGIGAFNGQLWWPLLWRSWQDARVTSMQRLAHLLDEIDGRPVSIVITTSTNDEFFLRLRLMERGWRSVPTGDAYPGCDGFSVYRNGNSTVLHIRLEAQYHLSPLLPPQHAALMLASAYACPVVHDQDGAWLLAFGPKAEERLERPEFADATFPDSLSAPMALEAVVLRVLAPFHRSAQPDVMVPLLSARHMTGAEFAALSVASTKTIPQDQPSLAGPNPEMLRRTFDAYRPIPVHPLFGRQ